MNYASLSILTIFCILNLFAFAGAYSLTHFRTPKQIALGLPRPASSKVPSDVGLSYQTHRIPIHREEWLEAWSILVQDAPPRGTILLFPGNGGSKASQLLAPAQVFHKLGYDTLLVDFRGVGGSSGNTTTLGAREAKDVAIATNYARASQYSPPFILYGVSMGSAAILKATAEDAVNPQAVILELPFATMLNAVRSRLKAAKTPTFPIAELMIFWGSMQHGFNGFAHNPVNYARKVDVPTLLLQGALDRWTTQIEIAQILENLKGPKQLETFPEADHNLLVTVDEERWTQAIAKFISRSQIFI